uniref:Androglobin-like n=1 Tax=Saccoglossus kowalevskii TaxID=10224 RepID=A0ABM0LUQ5_SACKO|nr:PREDICTED: androglobin-like [Saccoglossus kowalevskii]
MALKRDRTSPDTERDKQVEKMTAYHREFIYPVLPIPLEQIYELASKILGKKMKLPKNICVNEEEEDFLPELSPMPLQGRKSRGKIDRKGSSLHAEKKTASVNLNIAELAKPGGRRASAFPVPGGEGKISALPGIEEFQRDTNSRKMSAPSVDDPRRSSVPSALDTEYWRDRAASIAASVIGSTGESKRHKAVIWPEFSDNDINQEKWEVPHKTKEKEKGKSPNLQHFFEDADGRIDMPPSLKQKVDHWKRPQDFILDKTPIVFDENATDFDLMSTNEHIHDCELMRWIISQITTLWRITMVADPEAPSSTMVSPPMNHMWKPWEHIYAMNKVGKGPHIPAYNPSGKYVVRLYWMGCWRKIIVDDTIPFDDNENMLLPSTTVQNELWPMLLTKAIIKVASLDYNGGSNNSEFGDVTIIHVLTGWLPETIPLQYGHIHQVWDLVKKLLPEFTLPEPGEQKLPELDSMKKDGSKAEIELAGKDGKKDEKGGKDGKDKEKEKSDKPEKPAKEKDHKEDKKDKKDKDKDKDKDKRPGTQGEPGIDKDAILGDVSMGPQVAIFISYENPPKVPARVSLLGEMADASERLRQSGLSHVFPHPLLLTRTRSCPLVAPPPPPVVPAWKLIRQKKKKTTPHDQAPEPEIKRPEQWIEVTSPYVNYKVSPIPIPTDTKRPKSSLSRGGGSRPSTALMGEIMTEIDEDNPEKMEELLQKLKEQEKEKPKEESPPDNQKLDFPKPDTPSIKDGKDGKKGAKDEKKDNKREKSAAKLEKIEEPGKGRKLSSGLKRKESEKAPSLKSEKMEKSDKEKLTPIGKDPKDLKEKDSSLKPGDGDVDAMSLLTETASKADGSSNEEQEEDDKEKEKVAPVQKDIWMHFEDFAKCFKTLYIFHKPNTYISNHKMSDLKKLELMIMQKQQAGAQNVQPVNVKQKSAAPGGPAPASSMTAQTPARQPFSPSPQHHHHQGQGDDRQPQYMFVDSLESSEIIISFSSLSRWFDPPPEPPKTAHSMIRERKDRESDKDSVAASGGSLIEDRRHVLRFMMNAPLGYHIHLCSSTNLVFGDEETVMAYLTRESCRFVDHANQVMMSIKNAIQYFDDKDNFSEAMSKLAILHYPVKEGVKSAMHNFEVFNEALYSTLRNALGENFTADMVFAWKAFNYDVITRNVLGGVSSPGSRPEDTHSESGATGASRKSAKAGRKRESVEAVAGNREPTEEEIAAAIEVQKHWRGFYVRKIRQAREPGCEENLQAKEHLLKSWALMESTWEQHALTLFRTIFKIDPELMPKFPFYQDEWNKISYSDYQGNYPDQPPNTWFVVFRYSVKVTEDQIAAVQLSTSKSDVYILLQVLDNEVEVAKTTGKGHVVIPSFTFLRDRDSGEDQPPRRSSSRASQRGGSKLHTSVSGSSLSSGKKRQESAGSGRGSRGSRRSSADLQRPDEEVDGGSDKEQEYKPHKYIIQAKVLRKSWPLSESSWAFVQVLKDLEKSELKAIKDRPTSAPKSDKAATTVPKGGGGGKKGKDKGKEKERDKLSTSRPPSQQFDISKPNWTLRVVLDQTPTEEIEIKKDTERQDEIRAMKQAWEAAEPGRALKAQASRAKFLAERMIKTQPEDDEPTEPTEPTIEGPPKTPASEIDENPADVILLNEPPPPPAPKEILQVIDKTPFIRSTESEPRLLDDEEMNRQRAEQEQLIQQYKAFREEVLTWREEDRKRRNLTKEMQIQECEELQEKLDKARKGINTPREEFRQKFLEAERKRLEEIASQEAALKAEQEKSSPSPKGRKSAKGKKSAGKKKK